MARVLAAAGAVLVALSLWFSFGVFDPWALALVTAGVIVALAAAAWPERGGEDRARGAERVLAAGAALGLVTFLLAIPGDERAPAQHPYVVSLAALALATLLSYGLPRPPRWLERARFPVLLCAAAGMMIAALLHDEVPLVDVWVFRQLGARGLLDGHDPYALFFPNIYKHTRFYEPGSIEGGWVNVYPYPPLNVLADVPALLLGDVRWGNVAAVLLAAALIARLGRGAGAELAAAVVLFQPRTLYLVEVSWSEPLVLAAWALALHLSRRWHAQAPGGWVLGGLGLGLVLSTKQYAPLLAAPLVLAGPRAGRARAVAAAAVVVAAIAVPFVVWNPGQFWHDVVVEPFLHPARRDALSWLAAWYRWRGTYPSAVVGFTTAAVTLALALRGPPSRFRSAATAGAAFLVLVLFNTQAFCNYYWLAAGLLASAAAVGAEGAALDRSEPAQPRDAGEAPGSTRGETSTASPL